jgi:protease I
LAETVDQNNVSQRTPAAPATGPVVQKLNPLDGFDLPMRVAPPVAWRQGDWSQPRRGRRLPRVSKPFVASMGAVLLLAVLSGLVYTFTAADSKRVLFVLPSQGFYYPDYAPVRRVLEERGVRVVVASTTLNAAQPDVKGGGEAVTPDILLEQAQAVDYDALVFGGGIGIKEFLSGQPASRVAGELIHDMLAADKPVGALCMGPAVLADAGVLKGKRATSFENVVWRLKQSGADWVNEPVVVSGRVITARGPADAKDFAQALLAQLGEDR